MMNRTAKSSMEIEIYEQVEILSNLFHSYVNSKGEISFELPSDINKIVFVASGSSYHCSRYGADLFGNVAGIEARAIYSSEFLLKAAVPHETDILYVFITQSGETSDTNEALKRAKELGMRTLAITNKKGSTIWNASDYKIDCCAGEEKSIAATKSLTSQMLCVTLLVLKYAQMKGIDINPYLNQTENVPQAIEQTYSKHSYIAKVAKKLSKYNLIVVTADGISYALAKEVSLKIKETSYICTISSILGEFMHGHVAVFNNKSAHIHVSVEDLHEIAIRNLNKIQEEYKVPLCYIGDLQDPIKSDFIVNVEVKEFIPRVFSTIVAGQILALEIAKSLGRNVDKPHGLNKVVK